MSMLVASTTLSVSVALPPSEFSVSRAIFIGPVHRKISFSVTSFRSFPIAANCLPLVTASHAVHHGNAFKFFCKFCGLKHWTLENLNLCHSNRKHELHNEFKRLQIQGKDQVFDYSRTPSSHGGWNSEGTAAISLSNETTKMNLQSEAHSELDVQSNISTRTSTSTSSISSFQQTPLLSNAAHYGLPHSLCIAVVGATGELARTKIFPALFALYYSGYLPENVCIFGYSRKNLMDDDLRSMIASTLTCRVDHRQNCNDKMDAFLRRTYHLNGGYDNREGMSNLNARMVQVEGESGANRIFYLSVPQEALLDVAVSLADNAQTYKGWNRIIIEKPFGFDLPSSHQLTLSLLSKFDEKQLYRIDHLLGRNTIENLTVLRFSNLAFMPLWNRTYIHNVQITVSEDLNLTRGRYFDGYGIIRDIVHSHIFQTIALLAMEPPVTLDGEDVRNEKVKVLRSIRKLEPSDVILGQCKISSGDKVDPYLNHRTPTFFAAALYIDNARWDGVPFLIKTGIGLMRHRVEIRIQFRNVPGNLYRERVGHSFEVTTNELILRDVPDEAILVRINNKIPGLGMQLDASELNLLYKDKYNIEVPDSYEQLLNDVIDGDNHLFMRSDEVAAAWNILYPVLHEIDKNNMVPELYELGSRGPEKAFYLSAKHGVRWLDD